MIRPRPPSPHARRALLLLVLGAIVISFSPVCVQLARVGPTTAAFYRMVIGGLPLVAWVVWRRRGWWGGPRHLVLAAVCGTVLATDLALWHRSIHYVGPGLATILANFQVFFVAGFGLLVLRERLSLRQVLAIPLAVTGLFLIFGAEWRTVSGDYRLGVGLGLLAAACYAGYLMALRQARLESGGVDAAVTVATVSLVTAAVLAAGLAGGGEGFAIPDRTTAGVLLAYGLGPQLLGWLLISHGLPGAPASLAGLVLLLQPALAFGWDLLFFARPTTGVELVGAGLALGAIYLGTVSGSSEQ